jgi:leucyl-tRNA synthetase
VGDYKPQEVEAKWQQRWAENRVFESEADPSKPKYYVLEMLPYPSGTLHMGHMRNYTIGDVVARVKRMKGFNVIHPMGWDAFGLPAENAAIKNKTHPRIWTNNNIAEFQRVLRRFGFSYDWRREISTCEPEYYRWNQWFFLRMLERGLAYRKKSRVNWCPKCCTVLANEQVINGGYCWRHEDTRVEARDIEQWFLKTTAYSDQLLDDLKQLEGGWPDRVIAMQRNWIGKSIGAKVWFEVAETKQKIEIFTTRIDTIYGASALILAPNHPLVATLIDGTEDQLKKEAKLADMRRTSVKMEDIATAEKDGFFTGCYALNPFNQQKIPIWVGSFVLMEYGTGAIMAVPAHDERDFDFAKKFKLPIPVVVRPPEGKSADPNQPYIDYGVSVNSGPYSGLTSEAAIEKMAADADSRGFGKKETIYRLRDWGISRQRYWGTPIPVIYCPKDGMVPVPDTDLPVILPPNPNLTGEGESPLATDPDFVNVKCPKCGGPARRETDTMDTFVDSSWYFYRYCDPKNDHAPYDSTKVAYWFPIDQYIGGITHAILHLLYARFWCKVMRDIGLVKHDEPITRLFTQGMVLKGGEAMSKSKGNVVGAIDMAEKFGADTGRLYTLFAAPPEKDLEWSEESIEGSWRFLNRVYRLVEKHSKVPVAQSFLAVHSSSAQTQTVTETDRALLRKAHQTLRRVGQDFETRWHFNSAIAQIMELTNALYASEEAVSPEVRQEVLEILILMVAPMAPHIAEELWEMLGHKNGLWTERWPQFNAELAKDEEVEIVVQINGRVRGKLKVAAGASQDEVMKPAQADQSVAAHLAGKTIKKVIFVPDKLLNIVVV